MIASSLLLRAGFTQVVNVVGGFDAWQQANLPSVSSKPVEV
jgi:rhodanese-related sulfurtransferase